MSTVDCFLSKFLSPLFLCSCGLLQESYKCCSVLKLLPLHQQMSTNGCASRHLEMKIPVKMISQFVDHQVWSTGRNHSLISSTQPRNGTRLHRPGIQHNQRRSTRSSKWWKGQRPEAMAQKPRQIERFLSANSRQCLIWWKIIGTGQRWTFNTIWLGAVMTWHMWKNQVWNQVWNFWAIWQQRSLGQRMFTMKATVQIRS